MKVVINDCYGGFCLSREAYEYLGLSWDGFGFAYDNDKMRASEALVACVEALGDRANGMCARLKVVEIPDDVSWYIDEYDGLEIIRERHRSWH